MSSPEEYEDADFRVLGEAEGLIEHFIAGPALKIGEAGREWGPGFRR